jgi:hypothetical protein
MGSVLDGEKLKRHSIVADQHVAIGRNNIACQREFIAELERGGHPTKTQLQRSPRKNCRRCA